MNVKARELILELSEDYADRLEDEQLDTLDELLADGDWAGAVGALVESLKGNQAPVSGEEFTSLELLCEEYSIELDVLDELDVV